MRWIVVFLLVWAIPGCGARTPAKSATMGVIDALDHPDPRDRLAVKTRQLAERYVDAALSAGEQKGALAISSEIVEGMIKGLSAHTPEERRLIEVLVGEAVEAAFREVEKGVLARQGALKRGEAELVRSARRTSGALAGSATEELLREVAASLGPDGRGPLAEALSAAMQRTSAAAAHGAIEQMASALLLLNPCSGEDPARCPDDLVRRLSRSAAVGIKEGVGRPLEVWPLIGVFVAGVVAAALGFWILRVISSRRGADRLGPPPHGRPSS